MKKLDRFAIYMIACLLSFNNAYQMIGTDYKFPYYAWILMGIFIIIVGAYNIISKK